MANRPARVSQIEVKRAISGALAAGLRIARVEVDHLGGKVTVYSQGVDEKYCGPNPDELLK